MIETRIPIAPDTSTTLTDETTEHIVNHKVTIKIDRDYLKKKYAELYERLAKIKLPQKSHSRATFASILYAIN